MESSNADYSNLSLKDTFIDKKMEKEIENEGKI